MGSVGSTLPTICSNLLRKGFIPGAAFGVASISSMARSSTVINMIWNPGLDGVPFFCSKKGHNTHCRPKYLQSLRDEFGGTTLTHLFY
jgi:hypothetical protein